MVLSNTLDSIYKTAAQDMPSRQARVVRPEDHIQPEECTAKTPTRP